MTKTSCTFEIRSAGETDENLQHASFKWKSKLPSIWSWNLRTLLISRCRRSCTTACVHGTGHRPTTGRTLPWHSIRHPMKSSRHLMSRSASQAEKMLRNTVWIG